MHGWNPRQMHDVVHDGVNQVDDFMANDSIEFIANHVASLKRVHDQVFPNASENIKAAQKRQKRDYERRHNNALTFSVGDKVLLHNLRRVNRKGGKHKDVWDGPYCVVKVITFSKLSFEGQFIYSISCAFEGDGKWNT